MLYRASLTGKHNRFSVPQLGYLGYHQDIWQPLGFSIPQTNQGGMPTCVVAFRVDRLLKSRLQQRLIAEIAVTNCPKLALGWPTHLQ
jgi:hypothetical protein